MGSPACRSVLSSPNAAEMMLGLVSKEAPLKSSILVSKDALEAWDRQDMRMSVLLTESEAEAADSQNKTALNITAYRARNVCLPS